MKSRHLSFLAMKLSIPAGTFCNRPFLLSQVYHLRLRTILFHFRVVPMCPAGFASHTDLYAWMEKDRYFRAPTRNLVGGWVYLISVMILIRVQWISGKTDPSVPIVWLNCCCNPQKVLCQHLLTFGDDGQVKSYSSTQHTWLGLSLLI